MFLTNVSNTDSHLLIRVVQESHSELSNRTRTPGAIRYDTRWPFIGAERPGHASSLLVTGTASSAADSVIFMRSCYVCRLFKCTKSLTTIGLMFLLGYTPARIVEKNMQRIQAYLPLQGYNSRDGENYLEKTSLHILG